MDTIELLAAACSMVPIPIIASGGAGGASDMIDAFQSARCGVGRLHFSQS